MFSPVFVFSLRLSRQKLSDSFTTALLNRIMSLCFTERVERVIFFLHFIKKPKKINDSYHVALHFPFDIGIPETVYCSPLRGEDVCLVGALTKSMGVFRLGKDLNLA